jgi:predicted nucleotidyltransferase component of viral defense system
MNAGDRPSPHIHEDAVLFREAINFTAAQTGFSPHLIEKDYFCTLLLAHLTAAPSSPLVFKGGTCLAKIHAGFYRMSEDLDFVIPVDSTCRRLDRKRQAAVLKDILPPITMHEPSLAIAQSFLGANQSRQYVACVSYASLIQDRKNTIKIEVGLREPLITPAETGSARTALLDPISAVSLVAAISVPCISKSEAFAEKFRAALTRREVAIRDFYDIDYGVTRLGIRATDTEMVQLVREKIAIPGNDPVNVSELRMSSLRGQLKTRLRPVLRQSDFDEFDLDRAMSTVLQIAEALAEP